MNFRKGDKVKFLNDVGGGVVTRVIDKNLIGVLSDDGFEIPVLASELVKTESAEEAELIAPELDSSESVENITADQISDDQLDEFSKEDKQFSLFLGILPLKDDELEINLINDSNYQIYYTISSEDNGYFKILSGGLLEDNTKFKIKTIKKEEFLEIDSFSIQAIVFRKGSFIALKPISKIWKPKKTNFFKDDIYTENDFFHEKAYIYNLISNPMEDALKSLTDSEINKHIKEKEIVGSKKVYKSPNTPKQEGLEEIDLHIEHLVDNHVGMSNKEIMEIQLARFTTTLEGAIRGKTKRIVFIHGIGNGKLKYEVTKTLDRKYPRLRYQNASFKEYGYGATMVIIR